jgi:hypothetical protein
VILVVSLVVSSSLLLTSGSTLLQQNEPSTKAETMFSLLEESNSTVIEIFQELEEDGVVIPQESISTYNQALILANESQILLQTEDYSAAEDKIIQSLEKFKKALTITYASIDDQTSQQLTSVEKYSQIQSSINRYNELLAQIITLIRFAEQPGFNTTILQEKIQAINSLLTSSSFNLEKNRFEVALGNIAEARELGNQITNALREYATLLKTSRLETYIENTEERLELIKRTTTSLSANYPTSTIDAAITALESAESSLNNAKTHLENDQISDTLIDLANSKASEEQAVNYLKSEDTTGDPTLSNDSVQVTSP